jgi:hypothetical protein
MPSSPSSDLLQPSLVDTQPREAPYSLQTAFLTSFFGGPLAALAIFGINARRIGRLRSDAVWVAALLVACVAFEAWWRLSLGGQAFDAWLIDQFGKSGGRYFERLSGLVVFALSAAIHRREHKASDLMGAKRPNGLGIGVVLIVGAWVVSALLKGLLA